MEHWKADLIKLGRINDITHNYMKQKIVNMPGLTNETVEIQPNFDADKFYQWLNSEEFAEHVKEDASKILENHLLLRGSCSDHDVVSDILAYQKDRPSYLVKQAGKYCSSIGDFCEKLVIKPLVDHVAVLHKG